MYKENNPKKKNIKALFLLIVLTVFGVVVFKYTRVNKISADTTQNTEVASCSADVVDNSYESDGTFWYLEDDGTITDITPKGSVLGTTACAAALNKYSNSSACVLDEETSASLTSQRPSLNGRVNSSADIKMAIINAPIILLSGSDNVQDSTGNLTSSNGYFPPAGKVIKNVMIESSTTPGEEHEEVKKEVIDEAVKEEPYSAEYEVSIDTDNGGDEFTIAEETENNCGVLCDNESNTNPDLSNKASTRLYGTNYALPGYSLASEDGNVEETLQVEKTCSKVDSFDLNSLAVPVCFSAIELIKGTFGTLFPSSDWQCTNDNGEETDCINAEDIAVKISPMFDQTNKYLDTRNREQMDPELASSYKPTYIITNCVANVGGKLVDVKCVWDLSYLFHERQAAEFDDIKSGETPSLEAYKSYLAKESAERQNDTKPI